jgi:hypothetical protein
MLVQLDKETVLKIDCYSREAERSVHRSLDAKWVEFQAYYRGTKSDDLNSLTHFVAKLVGSDGTHYHSLNREEVWKFISQPGILRYLFGHWIANQKKSWSFPIPAISFVASTFKTLINVLDNDYKPASDQLISLRMDFGICEAPIENRCHGLKELELAQKIDHFHRTDWLPFVTLQDVLGKRSSENRNARKSA